jgi:hypothetical protein
MPYGGIFAVLHPTGIDVLALAWRSCSAARATPGRLVAVTLAHGLTTTHTLIFCWPVRYSRCPPISSPGPRSPCRWTLVPICCCL